MITKLFLKLTDYPAFRRALWKPVYELLAKRFKVKNWCFMNYGYAPAISETPLVLEPEDEINRYSIQLYYYLACKVNFQGTNVLEVGSGRGGGVAFLKKYFDVKKIAGLDIASNAIKIATEYFGKEGIEFVEGSAEKLPFADESFGIVINIESSHTYGSVPVFLQEVKRVLKSGGHFLCADIRTSEAIETFKNEIHSSGLEVIVEENISDNVRSAIELEEPIKQKRIEENIPKVMHDVFKQFAGVKGSKAHLNLQNGQLIYYRFVLKKA